MSYRETYENLCVLLEEYADADTETVAEQALAMLALTGEDLLESLDPPPGLQTWLHSHGVSLVATVEARSPRVWGVLQAEGDEEVEEEEAFDGLEERQPDMGPSLQVGDFVDYRTAPSGPHSQSQIGSGRVNAITSEGWVIVQDSPTHEQWLNPEAGDFIRQVRTPELSPQQSVQAPPL